MHDLRTYHSDAQTHVTADHVTDDSSWYSSQPYHTCTLPYGHADEARANPRIPEYTAGSRQRVDQRCVCESSTENQLNRIKTKSPPRWLIIKCSELWASFVNQDSDVTAAAAADDDADLMVMMVICIQCGSKKVSQRNLHITSSNTGRFSKFLRYNILQEICNETVIKYPTSP